MGRTGKLVVAGVVVLVLALGGGYLFFASRNSDAPPPAALGAAPSTTSGGATGTTGGDGASTTPDGTWKVSGDGSSFVGYRINEELAFLNGPNQAVGRTKAVTGTMTVADDTVEQVKIQADLTQLTSDEDRRDNAIRQRGLESERFPTATLELAEPMKLAPAPAEGEEVRGTGNGRLTVHGVTRDVDLSVTGRWSGSSIQVAGQLPVKLSDYQIVPPRFGPVVSIEDSAVVDFSLVFERG